MRTNKSVLWTLLTVLMLSRWSNCVPMSDTAAFSEDPAATADPNKIESNAASSLAAEFWEQIYQNSMLNTKSRYNVLNDERVCFTCPIDRTTFTSLYHEALDQSSSQALGTMQSLPPLTITWAAQLNENRVIFFCRNNSRLTPSPVYLSGDVSAASGTAAVDSSRQHGAQLEYSCESNRLCLNSVKSSYPKSYQCFVKSYVLNVKLDVIVQLQYVLLYFTGDSVKFDYQKEVTVQEGQPFTIKCEVPETNPVSIVSAYIDNQELALTALDKKTLDNRMTINTYSFLVNATRNMNLKKVKCEAVMRDLPTDLANTIDLRSHLSKDYTLSVHYLPTCAFPSRTYKTGINRSIVIECPINASNPDVTYYKIIPPSTRTKFELIDSSLETLSHVGRFRIQPSSQGDFGLYECIPRSLAGTAKCDINVELGATPNPPEQCMVQFAKVNNKTFAQFSCKPGYNQGGSSSFLTIYEIVDKQLKLSGRVNIDESKMDKEVPYITPADEDKYYEFLIMQENNYGNSTSVLLTLGTLPESKPSPLFELRNVYWIAGGGAALLLLICICSCCCCSDSFTTSKNDSACARCCLSSDSLDDDGLTYKKAPMDADALGSPMTRGGYSGGYTPVDTLRSNSLLKMSNHHNHQQHPHGGGGNYNSNYEYYDNTTATGEGLYGTSKKRAFQATTTVKSNKAAANSYDAYEYELQREYEYEDEEKVIDDEDDDNGRAEYEDENGEREETESMSSSRSEKNTNSTSGNEESSGAGHELMTPTYAPAPHVAAPAPPSTVPKPSTATHAAAMFNNNVSGSIGSGVESIKKHTYGLTSDPRSQNTKIGCKSAYNANNSTYSTIDKKKLIKTDNGLVYTPVTNSKAHENGARVVDGSSGSSSSNNGEVESPVMMNDMLADDAYDYDNFETVASMRRPVAALLKKPNQFQTELSQKLKSINSGSGGGGGHMANASGANHATVQHTSGANQAAPEHMSNSTATTSISSASSCASNSDLIVHNKKVVENYNHYSQANNNKSLSSVTRASEINVNGNKNYSLLKTTINVAAASSSSQGNSGTLGRNNKPPILKPKPRSNGSGIYQQVNANGKIVYDSPSAHNQSGEPLLHNEIMASPSTSITDISSTNCTPQHGGGDELTSSGPGGKPRQIKPNHYTSNTLSRPGHVQQQQHLQPAKLTTTFGPNNGLYSTVKSSTETMRTFGENGTVATTDTLGKKNQSSLRKIEENNYETVMRPVAPLTNGLTRTMERRHVKNSEI